MKLKPDDIFIYPTDTVWGIGASIYSEEGYKKIAAIKKTSEHKPLSIMFTDINEFYKSFTFPSEINLSWLKKYFCLESTLGMPLASSKILIPSWVTQGSDIVSVRVLEESPVLKSISRDLSAPFFTTSLNVTGEAPIIDFEAAFNFQKKHAGEAYFYGDSSQNLSGHSSTIIFYRNGEFQIIRAGRKMEEIKEHLSLLKST